MAQPLIEIVQVSKSYLRGQDRLLVLDHVSLSIARGEYFALMGPSGSGKTTLLNLIAGIDVADEGTVTVAGVSLQGLSESQLAKYRLDNIGFVFQFYNLIPVLTAIENVSLPLSLLKMNPKEKLERAHFALDLVDLRDRLNHFPGQLSGGQEQRVAIARALVTDPAIIIADEPTGDLDRQSATEILELLSRLNDELKKTIVMVTHDEAAARFAKQIIKLDKGRLVQ